MLFQEVAVEEIEEAVFAADDQIELALAGLVGGIGGPFPDPFRDLPQVAPQVDDVCRTIIVKAYDDFEDTPIPATVLIDKQGRVYWSRLSHQSFHNFDFLLGQIRFLNDAVQAGQGLLARK